VLRTSASPKPTRARCPSTPGNSTWSLPRRAAPLPDPERFTREMARVLKPNGVAAMIDNVVPEDRATGDYINAFEKFRDPSHVRAYTTTEWVRYFTGAGFKVEHSEIFRKARDFEAWAGLQTVSDSVKRS